MLGAPDRRARDAFLLSWCHLGLLSAADAAADLCLGGDRPALRRELAAGLDGLDPRPPALAKAAAEPHRRDESFTGCDLWEADFPGLDSPGQ